MKIALIKFYIYLDQVIDFKRILTFIAWIFSALVSLYCLILLALPLYETSAPKGIVFARDNDGGRAIETSMASRWYNSNHFAPYGNVYYRLGHTLADLIPLAGENLAAVENREKSHAFSLKMISLLSVFSLCLYLAFIFLGFVPETLLWANVLTLASLKVDMWATWVFRPHPEHLLSLALVLALHAFAKFLIKPDDKKNFIISALFWGLAMAVKRSTSAFIPGIILFLIFPFNKSNTKKAASYVGFMLLSYFLVGFPQNFGFVKHIKFLLYESSLHSFGGVETILKGLPIIWEQIWFLLPLFLFLSFFSEKAQKHFTFKFVAFVLISALPILLRKLAFEGDHHTMPIAISFLMAFIFLFTSFNPINIQKGRRILLCLIPVILLKIFGIPNSYTKTRNIQMECREEIDEINSILKEKASANFSVLSEAFFPSSSSVRAFTKTEWGIRWSDITKDVGLIGINSSTINEYSNQPPKYFYGKMIENWDEKQSFYRTIKDKVDISGPFGNYKKVYAKCGFELWEKKK
jgi:hypothetical protein